MDEAEFIRTFVGRSVRVVWAGDSVATIQVTASHGGWIEFIARDGSRCAMNCRAVATIKDLGPAEAAEGSEQSDYH